LLGNEVGSLPGVVIHAFSIAQLIDGETFNRRNVLLDSVIAVVVAGMGVGLALLGIGLAAKLAMALLGIAVIWGGGFALFYLAGVMAPLFTPSLAFAMAIALSTAVVAHYDRRKKKFAEAMVRRRNESLHKVVENSFDCIVIATADGEIISTNSSADRVMGWQPADVIGSDISGLLPDPDALGAEVLDIGGRAGTASGRGFQPVETEAVRADGTPFTMELVVYTAPVSFGTPDTAMTAGERVSYIYSFRDISVRRQAEQAREEARHQAEAANRAKTEFLANMSHELRTPLNAIIGFSELMRTEALGPLGSPQYLEYMNDINGSGLQLIQIINDILDMSKIEAGELSPIEDVFDFARAVDTSLRLVADRAQKGEVSLVNKVSADIPPIYADERMVKQILLNLLSNAVKFTPKGGVVQLSAEAGPLEYVFSVSDTGCGIPEDKMDIILQPFGQADMTLQRNYEGTGLGLPLVKAMAELHGGKLEISSEEGKGTTATVRLPSDRVVERPVKIAS
jgi:PAS domain S-box-containing protein